MVKTGSLFLVAAAIAGGASWQEDLLGAERLRAAGQTAQAERLFRGAGFELNSVGQQLYSQAKYADAEAFYRKAAEAFDQVPETSVNHALVVGNLGVALRAQARYAEGEARLAESLRELEQLTGPTSLETARVLTNLAALHWASGNLAQGESLSLRAEGIYQHIYQQLQVHHAERGGNRQILASIYLAQRRFADADKLLRNMLEDGDDRIGTTTYANLTVAAIGMDDFERAEGYARRSVELARRTLPAGDPTMAACFNNLAQSLRFQAKYLEAEGYYREAIAIWEASLGSQHPDVGRGLMNLAAFYHERGRESGAEDLYGRAAQVFEQSLGKQDPQTLIARNELADVLRAERRYTESEKLTRLTIGEMEKAFRADDPRLVRALLNYARLLVETRRSTQAQAVLKKIPHVEAGFR